MKPKYEHDCEECIFLGPIFEDGRTGDGYIHVREPKGSSDFVVRWADEGADYSCMPLDSINQAMDQDNFGVGFAKYFYLHDLAVDIKVIDPPARKVLRQDFFGEDVAPWIKLGFIGDTDEAAIELLRRPLFDCVITVEFKDGSGTRYKLEDKR